jgi:hypothetical protein
MAHFRGTIQGQRGSASRLGSAKSGLIVKANGWNFGVTVNMVLDQYGNDMAYVWITGGSNGAKSSKLLGLFDAAELDTKKMS